MGNLALTRRKNEKIVFFLRSEEKQVSSQIFLKS